MSQARGKERREKRRGLKNNYWHDDTGCMGWWVAAVLCALILGTRLGSC